MPAPLDDEPRDDDPLVAPARYPGPPAPGSGLLADGRFEPLSPDDLNRLGQPPYDDRVLVVAVGANASPGRTASDTCARSTARPQWLSIATIEPSTMPRAEASCG